MGMSLTVENGQKMLSSSGIHDTDRYSACDDSEDFDGEEFCVYHPNGDLILENIKYRSLDVGLASSRKIMLTFLIL